MATVTINAPKTPVTDGNDGTASATVPNVCKMPGPPAPFVPTPLPNIGKSGITPKGYSVKVRVEGSRVAIRGATFGSQGDGAAKSSGGGLISANVEGLTKFVGPGSMDVFIEGKNVHLLGDPMLNNCGPSGAPPNAATLTGIVTPSGDVIAVTGKDLCPLCKKKHEPLAETEESKADASKLRVEFIKATQPYKDPKTGESRKPGSTATMLGVVHGKCGTGKYAGQSGSVHKELYVAAKESKLESLGKDGPSYFPPEGVSNRAYKKVMQPKDAEAIAAVKEGMFALVGEEQKEAFEEVWKKAAEATARSRDPNAKVEYASYPPGRCAAQKTLLLARECGCFPGAMTERWHHPHAQPTEGAVRHYNAEGELGNLPFGDGTSVPPCGTCARCCRTCSAPATKRRSANTSPYIEARHRHARRLPSPWPQQRPRRRHEPQHLLQHPLQRRHPLPPARPEAARFPFGVAADAPAAEARRETGERELAE
ncbi:MAG TPA: PAAR-like domain-containing protein [Polyangiales bacterium]|nr:PAAR-like domain-containing protein [Polyangiales bacterium]